MKHKANKKKAENKRANAEEVKANQDKRIGQKGTELNFKRHIF